MNRTTPALPLIGASSGASVLHACRMLLLAVTFAALSSAAHASGPGETSPEPAAGDVANAAAAVPDDTTDRRTPRKFLGFATDAAISPGLWTEMGEIYRQDAAGEFVTFTRAAYGWRNWEFGGDIAVDDSERWSNLGLWAKFVGWKLGPADIGAGMLTEIPTSGGDFDAAPFATASLPVSSWDLRSTFGYVITEEFFYNAACLRPIGERIDFRTELAGAFDDGFDGHIVSLLPGLDFHFPIGNWQILMRLSAGARLHPSVKATAGLSLVVAEL